MKPIPNYVIGIEWTLVEESEPRMLCSLGRIMGHNPMVRADATLNGTLENKIFKPPPPFKSINILKNLSQILITKCSDTDKSHHWYHNS
jgi:hypothetical protein